MRKLHQPPLLGRDPDVFGRLAAKGFVFQLDAINPPAQLLLDVSRDHRPQG
jgi:hypothetical protein